MVIEPKVKQLGRGEAKTENQAFWLQSLQGKYPHAGPERKETSFPLYSWRNLER